jgi:hypothetical protein
MGRSSIGWRRSATSNTVSNDNTEENYATCHHEALARKIGRAENSTRRRNHERRDGCLALEECFSVFSVLPPDSLLFLYQIPGFPDFKEERFTGDIEQTGLHPCIQAV